MKFRTLDRLAKTKVSSRNLYKMKHCLLIDTPESLLRNVNLNIVIISSISTNS